MAGLLDFLNTDEGRIGLGLLAAAGPSMAPMGVGQRLQMGLQYAQDQKQNDLKRQYMQAQMGSMDLGNQKTKLEVDEMRRKNADADQARAVLREFYGSQGIPSAPSTPMVPTAQSMVQAPSGMQSAAPASGQQTQATGAVAPKVDEYTRFKSLGDLYASKGLPDFAQQAYAQAEKFRPKYSTTPQVVRDPKTGQLVNVLISEDGTQTVMPYGVRPDIQLQSLGDKVVAIDKNAAQSGSAWAMGQSPDSRASNALGYARLGFDREQASKPQYHDGAWVSPPTMSNPQGGFTPTANYVPPKGSPENVRQSSNKALGLIDQAEKLLDQSTGSYLGAAADQGAALFGASTTGAQAAAKLKALEVSLMMAQPRMEGPQSDKDVALYRQMAAQIGDPTVPVETRRAALGTIRELHQKYAGSAPVQGQTQQQAPSVQSKFVNVNGKQLAARRASDGKFYVQQNGQYFEVKD